METDGVFKGVTEKGSMKGQSREVGTVVELRKPAAVI